MATQSNARKYIQREMKLLAEPITRNRLGKRTAYEMIGLLYCILQDKQITDDDIMVALNKVKQVIKKAAQS